MNEFVNLPLFPLPIFLLPQGITQLRIFEPRYLKMISIATKGQGFIIQLNSAANDNNHASENNSDKPLWGSWVEVINFAQDSGGVLTVDVKCRSLVNMTDISTDEDNLAFAKVTLKTHWPEISFNQLSHELTLPLVELFEKSDDLSQLYQSTFINEANWVLARWLELLPIDLKVKDMFADHNSYHKALKFVHSVIVSEPELKPSQKN